MSKSFLRAGYFGVFRWQCQKFFAFDGRSGEAYAYTLTWKVPLSESRSPLVRLSSWAVYDLANTVFSAVVLTVYFPLYLTSLSGSRSLLGAATTGSMILAGLVTPWVGALSDKTGRTKRYLVLSTLLCIAALSVLSVFRTPAPLIACFIAACFFYHASLVFYNALLPAAAAPEKQGFASGLGTGLGYLGVVLTLPLMNILDKSAGVSAVFFASAFLFFLFSLPLFFFVPERKVPHPEPFSPRHFHREWSALFQTVRGLPKTPKLMFFLAGNFFLVDAVNSVIFWLSVYTRDVFQPTQDQLIFVLMGLNISAFLSGLISGFLCDRLGAMKVLKAAAASLFATLILLTLPLPFPVFIAVCFLGGSFALAGTWTAGRKVVLELAPEEKTGEHFGLYGLTTKISVLGSFLYGLASDAFGMRQGLGVLILPAALGWGLLVWSGRLPEHSGRRI